MNKTITKESRAAHYKELRERWKVSKELAAGDEVAQAVYRESGLTGISYMSFYLVRLDMKAEGYDGLPYVDMKTFKGWKSSGFTVKKGEHSKVTGIVWMHPRTKDTNGDVAENTDYMYPKAYHLFHTSQVETIGTKEAVV